VTSEAPGAGFSVRSLGVILPSVDGLRQHIDPLPLSALHVIVNDLLHATVFERDI
jgi:hypothetical protein